MPTYSLLTATEFFSRSERVKETERTLGELFSNINNNGQPFDPEYLDELSNQFEDIKYHIECEKSAIEWKDLRGPKINKDQNDLFVD